MIGLVVGLCFLGILCYFAPSAVIMPAVFLGMAVLFVPPFGDFKSRDFSCTDDYGYAPLRPNTWSLSGVANATLVNAKKSALFIFWNDDILALPHPQGLSLKQLTFESRVCCVQNLPSILGLLGMFGLATCFLWWLLLLSLRTGIAWKRKSQ